MRAAGGQGLALRRAVPRWLHNDARHGRASMAKAKPIWKLEVGEPAPEFRLRATGKGAGRGEPFTHVSLADYRGKKNVVLVFFPAAFTPV